MTTGSESEKPVIGISVGDTNGIGMEVIIKTFSDTRMNQVCTPIIYGNAKLVSFYRKNLGINELNYNSIRTAEQHIPKKLNVMNCWEEEIALEPGIPTETSGKYAIKSLEAAISDLSAKKIDALVTAPINKENISKAGFSFPGHTEYLAQKFNSPKYLMFMVSERLKIAVVSGHIPLKNAASALTKETILDKLKVMKASLVRDFGIIQPRIAVLGVNPHAGDKGLLGSEEKDIIKPAIDQALQEGILAFGPYAADGFFGTSLNGKFDGVLAMYHDQGLIPFKAIAFDEGVNYTAGLPIVRTSPDHGTAYDIAGKNLASESSFRHAVYTAIDIIQKRREYLRMSENPLPMGFSKLSRDQ